MQKVLIADGSEQWCAALAQALAPDYLVECCHDGQAALELSESFGPDVLILDLMLSVVDGLSVLQTVCAKPNRPHTIVTGICFSPFVSGALNRFQVDYALLKPCTVRGITDRVRELASQTLLFPVRRLDPYDCVTAMLLTLNAPTSQSGFRYLRDGILMMMEDPDQQLTKSLYPNIAKLHGTSPGNVEKSIRTTVTTAWKRRREDVWRQYFPLAPNGQIPKPTSGQFLSRMADALTISLRQQA